MRTLTEKRDLTFNDYKSCSTSNNRLLRKLSANALDIYLIFSVHLHGLLFMPFLDFEVILKKQKRKHKN